ncbi:hypothetical protein ASG51_14435 [Methylobacterium sp. Leaf465]|nr:hypothetical protein ASG51_14435 [Methylobacterium sp. Leaf465]
MDPSVQGGTEQDEVGPGGKALLYHQLRENVLAPQLLKTRLHQRGSIRIDEEAAGPGGLGVAGPRRGRGSVHSLDVLDLYGDDRGLTIWGDNVEQDIEGGAVAEVIRPAPTGAVLKAQVRDGVDEAWEQAAPDPTGEIEILGQRGQQVEGQGLAGE